MQEKNKKIIFFTVRRAPKSKSFLVTAVHYIYLCKILKTANNRKAGLRQNALSDMQRPAGFVLYPEADGARRAGRVV